jgi:arginine/serine-rich splicing factor 4/5/6
MPGGQRVYIGNIPSNAGERDVEKFFKGYGRLREVVVKNGYGFVEFESHR